MIDDLVKEYGLKYELSTIKPNYTKIPVNRFNTNTAGADMFNIFYHEIINDKELNRLVRTPSGGISIKTKNLRLPAYDISIQKSLKGVLTGLEIVIISNIMCRIQFCGKPQDVVGGSVAFKEIKKIFSRYDINIDDYAVSKEKGMAIKEEIEKPMIQLSRPEYRDLIFENVHHLDFHSSYPTGLINTHPEFKEPIEWIYANRHVKINGYDDYYKGVMNSSIGYFQSQYCGFKYAQLSKDAINDNNRRIRELAARLTKNDRIVLLYNTDGIWYQGDLYHDENEGKGLGTWQNDHINCKFRAKSDGAYEFEEDGKYYPVVRGSTLLDRKKPRTQWEWGDIYQNEAQPIIFRFDEEVGISYGTKSEL